MFQNVFGKMVKIKEMFFLLSKCLVSIAHHCTFHSEVASYIHVFVVFLSAHARMGTSNSLVSREDYISFLKKVLSVMNSSGLTLDSLED